MRALAVLLLTSLVASAADEKIEWKNLVDPATVPAKVEWPKDHSLNLAAPKSFWDPELTFSEFGGPFAALGRHGPNDVKNLIDLRTGNVVTQLSKTIDPSGHYSLSRDGQHIAIGIKNPSGGFDQLIAVFETATSKKIQEFGPFRLDTIQLAGDRLMVHLATATNVYDFKTGKKLLSTDHPDFAWGKGKSTLTPGGKFLLDRHEQGYNVYDVQEGKKLFKLFGPAPMDGNPARPATRPRPGRPAPEEQPTTRGGTNPEGVSISHDGKKLAIAAEGWGKWVVGIYDMQDGKELAKYVPPAGRNVWSVQRVNWSADGVGLLFNGEFLLDPLTGRTLYTLPAQGLVGFRMMTTQGMAIVLEGSDRNDRKLLTMGLKPDQIAAAKAAVESGGTPEDAFRPVIIKNERTKARVAAVADLGSDWNVKPDPAPDTFAAQTPVKVPFRMQNLRTFMVTAGATPVAVMEFTPGGEDAAKPRSMKRVDVRSGKVTAEFEIAPGLWIADVSPDGTMCATTDYHQGYKRLDIYPMEDKAKPYGFRPFPLEGNANFDTIIGTYFLSADRILLVSEKGTVSLFSLPDGALLYTTELPGLMSVAISPNRKYLACVQNGIVRMLDMSTGLVAGDLFPSFIQGANQKTFVTFRPDGKELAAGIQHPRLGSVLVRWDLTTGKILGEDRFSSGLGVSFRPGYLSDSTVMINHSWVYDFNRQAMVWSLPLIGEGRFAWTRPDSRIWYAMSNNNFQEGFIIAVPFPDANTETIIADVIDGPGAILKPDTTISIKFDIQGGMSKEYAKQIQDAVTKQCAAQGLKVVNAGGAVDVNITVTERDTGEQLSFRQFGRFGGGDTVPVLELSARTSIYYAGEKLWEPPASTYLTSGGFGIIHLRNNETVQEHMHRAMWNNVVFWAQNSGIPRYLAKTENGVKVLPQSSMLTPTGIQSTPIAAPTRRR